MQLRLGSSDIPDKWRALPIWASQALFAFLCSGAMIAARSIVDSIAPGAGPFAMVYPAIMTATIFGRWLAGVATLLLTTSFAWYVVLPIRFSFAFSGPDDISRLVVNTASGIIVIILAEMIRHAFRRAAGERNARIAEQALLLREIDHRVKNNFAIVIGLLTLQQRQAADEPTRAALAAAVQRVGSIAQAHNHLYSGDNAAGDVDMKVYIESLAGALSEALFSGDAVTLVCDCAGLHMPRDRAVAIGIIINELVTNAAKHAFAGRDKGLITVGLHAAQGGAVLTVSDNGIGMPQTTRDGALGNKLILAFVQQANGTLEVLSGPSGSNFTVTLK